MPAVEEQEIFGAEKVLQKNTGQKIDAPKNKL